MAPFLWNAQMVPISPANNYAVIQQTPLGLDKS